MGMLLALCALAAASSLDTHALVPGLASLPHLAQPAALIAAQAPRLSPLAPATPAQASAGLDAAQSSVAPATQAEAAPAASAQPLELRTVLSAPWTVAAAGAAVVAALVAARSVSSLAN